MAFLKLVNYLGHKLDHRLVLLQFLVASIGILVFRPTILNLSLNKILSSTILYKAPPVLLTRPQWLGMQPNLLKFYQFLIWVLVTHTEAGFFESLPPALFNLSKIQQADFLVIKLSKFSHTIDPSTCCQWLLLSNSKPWFWWIYIHRDPHLWISSRPCWNLCSDISGLLVFLSLHQVDPCAVSSLLPSGFSEVVQWCPHCTYCNCSV